MSILRSHHIALKTPDFQRAKAFYTEVLGFDVVGDIPGRDIIFIDIGGTTIELIGTEAQPTGEEPQTGLVHLAFEVDDVDATFQELKEKDVVFHIEPTQVGDIRLAFFRDPDGNPLELFKCERLHWA